MKRFLTLLISFVLLCATTTGATDYKTWRWQYQWNGGGTGTDNLTFYSPFTDTLTILTPTKGTGPGTFTRASASYLTDFEGETRKIESGSVGVEGSRTVTNLLTYSEDLSNAAWATQNATSTATTVTFTSVGGSLYRGNLLTVVAGNTYRHTVYLRVSSGTFECKIARNDATTWTTATISPELTLTTSWQRFSISYTAGNGETKSDFVIGAESKTPYSLPATGTIEVYGAQVENVTGQILTTPGEYVATTTAAVTKCFSTQNSNTVNGTTGVVTEATGTALPQSYPERVDSTVYALNDKIQVSGWWYQCTTGGTSHSSAPTFPQGKAGTQTVADGTAVWTIGGRLLLGYVSEPASTNKTTAYGIIPSDSYGTTRTAGYTLLKGVKYEIVSRALYDFTLEGAANNTVGTQFVATAGGILLTGDSVKDVLWGTGTKSFHDGVSFLQRVTGLALAGDVAAVLSIVTDEAEIVKAGLAGINPGYKVYKLDNSLGSTGAYTPFPGGTGNTNIHTGTLIYKSSGLGSFYIAGAEVYNNITSTTVYRRLSCSGAVNQDLYLIASAGSVVYFLLPQLEELPYATSIMPTSGATATRAATELGYQVAGNYRTTGMSGSFDWTPNAVPSAASRWIWGSYTDASNYIGVLHDGTNLIFRKRVGGVNYDATKALTLAIGTTYHVGYRINANGSTDIFINGVKGTGSANTSTPVFSTDVYWGESGNMTDKMPWGFLRNPKTYFKVLSDSKMITAQADNYYQQYAA